MQFRTDKKSGNNLSTLGFGCMRFETRMGAVDISKAEKLLHKAIEQGVNYLDTAYIYPGSEAALGNILTKDLRDKVYIADKLPIILCKSKEDFDKYFFRQLERLKTNRIDYYLLHMLQDMDTWEQLCQWGIEEWFQKKKQEGLIGQAGFSFHGSREQFARLIDAYDWDFVQIQYNYVDEHNQAGRNGLLKAAEKGMSVIVMEPLLGGRLADQLPQKAKDIFMKHGTKSPAEWALRWVLNHPEVTVLLSGMNQQTQLDENIRIANEMKANTLTEQEHEVYQAVLREFNESFKVRCTGCGYCMPCPFGVNIPMCFAAYNARYSISKRTGFHQYMTNTGALSVKHSYASLCRACGKCVSHCPQKIAIPNVLKEVSNIMEPFWFRPGTALLRRIAGLKTVRSQD